MSWDPVPGRLILKPRHKGISGLPSFHLKKINKQKRKGKNSDGLELCRLMHRMKAKYEDTLIGYLTKESAM